MKSTKYAKIAETAIAHASAELMTSTVSMFLSLMYLWAIGIELVFFVLWRTHVGDCRK